MGCCGRNRPKRSIKRSGVKNNNPTCPSCGGRSRKMYKYDHISKRTLIKYICMNKSCKKTFEA